MAERCLRVAALATLFLVWAVTSGAAYAGPRHRNGTSSQSVRVRGLLTAVSSSSIRVQTSSGPVSVGLTSATFVSRLVTGSTADLVKGKQVDALLTAPGSTAIRSIHVELVPFHSGSSRASTDTDRDGSSKTRSSHSYADRGIDAKTSHSSTAVWGQIVSVSANSVTLRSHHGTTTTYTFAGNVIVTKTLPGRVSDLAVGQLVQAWVRTSTGAAGGVCILSS